MLQVFRQPCVEENVDSYYRQLTGFNVEVKEGVRCRFVIDEERDVAAMGPLCLPSDDRKVILGWVGRLAN